MALTKVTTGLIGNLAVDTAHLAAGAVETVKIAGNQVDGEKISLASEAQGDLMWYDGTNWARVGKGTAGQLLQGNTTSIPTWVTAGRVIQIVNTQISAAATGTTLMPNDDTIPQITEGDEYMTLAITPSSASRKLKIDVVCNVSGSAATNQQFTVALFQNTTAGALAAVSHAESSSTTQVMQSIHFTHWMTSGTTSATTFKIRAGMAASGTTTFNGFGGARKLGGVMASSITITEISM